MTQRKIAFSVLSHLSIKMLPEKYNKKYLLNKDGFVIPGIWLYWKRGGCLEMEVYDAFNRMERLVYEKNTAAIR